MSSDGPQYPQYPGQDPGENPRPAGPPPPSGQPPPPQPPGYGQPVPPVPAYGSPSQTNQKATWALVLGIIGLVCCPFGILAAIPAAIVGNLGRKEIEASDGMQTGRGMATAGLILGVIGILLAVIGFVFFGFMISTEEFQEGFREGYREGAP